MSLRNKASAGSTAGASLACCPSSFSRQPPRILVVDTAPPWWSEVCNSVCEALDNFLTLASSLEGPIRLALLSLYAVSSQTECLLPLSQVKGNLQRLRSCVDELRSLPREGCTPARDDLLQDAVRDGLLQFKQYLRHVTAGGPTSSSSVEVTVLTSRPGRGVVKQLEAGLKDMDLVSLRRLVVVCLAPESEPPPPPPGPDDGLLGTEMELQQVENDTVALETVFKGWLHDLGGDREHLHLLLPPSLQGPAPGHAPGPGPAPRPVCLKCDMQERLLSPALFLCTPHLGANTETAQGPSNQSAPPRRLTVVKVLKSDGVCESVLYGLPVILRPTSCWQLDWDEMEANHHHFHALCHALRSRDWFLLARCEQVCSGGSLVSHFVLQPSSSSLLLKPVASRELLLPCALPAPSDAPPHSALATIQAQLEEDPVFNPLCLESHLYSHLRSVQAHGLYPYRAQQRRHTPCPPGGARPPQVQQAQGRVRAVAPLPPSRSSRTPLPRAGSGL
ncbi:hypothetical protein AAFF_G00261650 [Aldrovandia affinis]|uniref:Meiosis 1 arrest protein n=1 Tax=Aldrovandia affinis TaxID=143900 RepID=A0AAD7W2R3_9TELE|nr:hypothetical protein AAFF_G00261650 [Aldrovandia affinis]